MMNTRTSLKRLKSSVRPQNRGMLLLNIIWACATRTSIGVARTEEAWSSGFVWPQSGFAGAQYNLGVCYLNGAGVAQDVQEALQWYRKAAEQGHDGAQYDLGLCYFNGTGVARMNKRRSSGSVWPPNRMLLLSIIWACATNGLGIVKDKQEAVRWYRKAAEQRICFSSK